MKLALGQTLIHPATSQTWLVISFDKELVTLRGVRGARHNNRITVDRACAEIDFKETPTDAARNLIAKAKRGFLDTIMREA